MHAPFLFLPPSLNTHLNTPILQFYYINAVQSDFLSGYGGFLLNASFKKTVVSFELNLDVYHFGVEVFNILRVEDSHESLCAYSLAAVFLSHHQCYVTWVVLEVVDERLALASYGLGDIHILFFNVRNRCKLQS